MSYKIEKEGYEFMGFKLGDYIGSDKIIGFDNKYNRVAVMGEYLVKCKFIGDEDNLDDVSVILVDHLNKPYKWVHVNKDKIRIKAQIWNTTIIVQTLHCEPFDYVSKNGIDLSFKGNTKLFEDEIFLGTELNIDMLYFNTQAEAQSYLDTLLELVEMVNNPVPVVDLRAYGFTNVSGFTVRVDDEGNIYLLYANGVTLMYWTRRLPLPIIKQQLEQILAHLGVKAEVRI